MEKHKYEGKNKEETIALALKELNTKEENLIINEKETKAGLFKKKIELEIITKEEVVEFVKTKLIEILKLMGLEANIEVKKIEERYSFSLFSDNNPILIGKNGKTIDAIQIITNQIIMKETGVNFKINVDVGGYKQKKQHNIEYLAKKTAKEVLKTKIPAKMDEMNSYERRIVHSILTDFEGIETISEGEEPNRYVIIKLKEE